MADTRQKDKNFPVTTQDGEHWLNPALEAQQLAVLMDIRDELKHLNNTLDCKNFRDVPRKLELIRRHAARVANKVSSMVMGTPK
jgi:hypothetical protein